MSRESVADELGKLLSAEGLGIARTPVMFGTLMRRACPDDGAAVDALEKVLTAGIVKAMREERGAQEQVPALADRLVQSTSMSEDDARWAIETWWRALRQAGEGPAKDWSAWNRLDVPESAGGMGASQRRSITQLVFVGIAGALGGGIWGVYVLARGEAGLIKPVADALEDFEGWMRPFALFALGGVGGFGGGILGWIGGGVRGWTATAVGGTTFGRLGLSATGAFAGAAAGAIVGLLLGLPVTMPGALVGGALGALLGLLIAERMS
jgi:hypothetical protein